MIPGEVFLVLGAMAAEGLAAYFMYFESYYIWGRVICRSTLSAGRDGDALPR